MNGNVSVDIDRTIKELDIDPIALLSSSNEKVIVQCNSCGESFLRHKRHQFLMHDCPRQNSTSNGIKRRLCSCCRTYLQTTRFKDHRVVSAWCIECERTCGIYHSKLVSLFIPTITSDQCFKAITHKLRSYCSRNNLPFDLDEFYLRELWDGQRGMCRYLDIPLTFKKWKINSAWLDTMNSNYGYVRSNVVWACSAVKSARSVTSDGVTLAAGFEMRRSVPHRLECVLFHPSATLPSRSRTGDAGLDIASIEDKIIPAGGTATIRTGIKLATKPGIYYTIEGRSSLWSLGIVPWRGVIDAGYTGEVIVILMNTSSEDYAVSSRDRIAQIILHHTLDCDVVIVNDFSPEYNERGTNGFGSTGK